MGRPKKDGTPASQPKAEDINSKIALEIVIAEALRKIHNKHKEVPDSLLAELLSHEIKDLFIIQAKLRRKDEVRKLILENAPVE